MALYGKARLLPPGFPTIDVFDRATGAAISIKSLDLDVKTYLDPRKLEWAINRYVDKLGQFTGSDWGSEPVAGNAIKSRTLDLVVPIGSGTDEQMAAINRAIERAERNGVKFKLSRH